MKKTKVYDNSVWTSSTQKSVHGACNMEYRMFAKEWESGTEIVQACLDLDVLGQVCEIARNRGRASAGRVLAERCCMKSTWFTNESKTISAELPFFRRAWSCSAQVLTLNASQNLRFCAKMQSHISVDFRQCLWIFGECR